MSLRLPADTTSFVGRRHELAQVRQLLKANRLVTITGMGGVGKTRVALRAAAAMRHDFPDGVYLVELSPLQDGHMLPNTVAAALELQHQSTHALVDVITEYVADRRMLLVLDTCEPLIEACGVLATDLLQAAPGLKILATSRQTLGLLAEHAVALPALAVPAEDAAEEDLSSYDAVALFAQRAKRVVADFRLSRDNQHTVASICRRLDGIPLAIELAAVRLRVLAPEQLLARLDDRFTLLTGGRGVAPRHQTLRAAIGWSHELCEPAERLLWARLSMFPGSFDLAAAEAVCADEALPSEEIFDLVSQLVEKSILVTDIQPGGVRFRLLDTVREYGRDWLASNREGPALARRHRDHYHEFAATTDAEWFGPRQPQLLEQFRAEYHNMCAGLEYCFRTPGEWDAGLGMAGSMFTYWAASGLVSEGLHWLDRALTVATRPSAVRVRALWAAGALAYLQGETARAGVVLQEALNEALAIGDEAGHICSLAKLGVVALLSADAPGAETMLSEAIDRFDKLGIHDATAIMARVELGIAYTFQGKLDASERICGEVRAMAAAADECWVHAYALYVLALAAAARGDISAGADRAGESLRLHHRLHNLLGIAMDIEVLASMQVAGGAAEQAATLHGAAERIWRATGRGLLGSEDLDSQHGGRRGPARALLGDEQYEAACERGRELDMDDAVAYALALKPN